MLGLPVSFSTTTLAPPISPTVPPGLAHLPPSIIPIFFPGFGNYSTPRIFHGIGGIDPGIFTSGGASGNGKPCPDLNGRKIPSGLHYVP